MDEQALHFFHTASGIPSVSLSLPREWMSKLSFLSHCVRDTFGVPFLVSGMDEQALHFFHTASGIPSVSLSLSREWMSKLIHSSRLRQGYGGRGASGGGGAEAGWSDSGTWSSPPEGRSNSGTPKDSGDSGFSDKL